MRVSTDEQNELKRRELGQQLASPGCRALWSRRPVATFGVLAGKTEPHRQDGDAALVMKFLDRDIHPRPQPIARGVAERCP